MAGEGIAPDSVGEIADVDNVAAGGAQSGASGWEGMLPRPGETHEGLRFGLRHGDALRAGDTTITGTPHSMDRVYASSPDAGSLSLDAMRFARFRTAQPDNGRAEYLS